MLRRSFVPVQGFTLFSPEDLKHLTLPDFVSLLQYNKSWGHIAFCIRNKSKIEGFWLGLLFERRAPQGSTLRTMVKAGYLSEKQDAEGWVYYLTDYTLGMLYKEYTSLQLALLRRDLLQRELELQNVRELVRAIRKADASFDSFFKKMDNL